MNIFVLGSSITSSYWNGAATYYRGCYKYLSRRGHRVTFAEPDAYGRQQHRDDGDFSYVTSLVYQPGADLDEVLNRAASADVIVKHSGLGVDDEELERRILACRPQSAVVFWDVDAPATIRRVEANPSDPLLACIPQYDAVLTYGGGPEVRSAYLRLGARAYHSIYNGLDPETHHPVSFDPAFRCDVVFLGNRLPDREARVEELFLKAAEYAPEAKFVLGGEGWAGKSLPPNVHWIGHVPTTAHNRVNCSASMVMNINRDSMAAFGFSPPTRVFEVAGAGGCLLCDDWPGVDDCFAPGKEMLIVRSARDVVDALRGFGFAARRRMGLALLRRALRDHTYARRALQAEHAFLACIARAAGEAEDAIAPDGGDRASNRIPYGGVTDGEGIEELA